MINIHRLVLRRLLLAWLLISTVLGVLIHLVFRLEPMVQQMLFGGMERRLLLVLLIVTGTTIALYPVIIQLNRSLWQSARKILQGNLETVSVLSAAIAMRDIETGDHTPADPAGLGPSADTESSAR